MTAIPATDEDGTWISTDNAESRFTFFARGPVEDDTRIVSFTATPHDPSKPMSVVPHSGLHVGILEQGLIHTIGALDVLRMIHRHVRHGVIGRWFDYGRLPQRRIRRFPVT